LVNEDVVIKTVGAADFEIVILSNMTVSEQVCLFNEATYIMRTPWRWARHYVLSTNSHTA